MCIRDRIISEIGLLDVGGVPKFQDATFKIVLPTKKIGVFSLFGLSGLSSLDFEDVKPSLWNTPGDQSMRPDLEEDFYKKSYLINTGINHTLPINNNIYCWLDQLLDFLVDLVEEGVFFYHHLEIFLHLN